MRTATWIVELGVGLACLIGAVAATRRSAHIAGALLGLAGAAATVHAVGALAGAWG